MKFGGNIYGNFSNADGSKDPDYKRDVILDEIARLIETDRGAVIRILKDAGFSIETKASKKEVIKKVSKALHSNKQFQTDIAKEIVNANNHVDFSNAEGKFKSWLGGLFNGSDSEVGSASGAGASASSNVAIGADPISAIAGAIGSIFAFGKANKDKKAQEEQTKRELFNKLLSENEKTNWMPIIIIGGVLLIGGIVAVIVLRNKNK